MSPRPRHVARTLVRLTLTGLGLAVALAPAAAQQIVWDAPQEENHLRPNANWVYLLLAVCGAVVVLMAIWAAAVRLASGRPDTPTPEPTSNREEPRDTGEGRS